ncbi:MAG: ISKra4 family transposase [Herpetosiphonaceae bacterium]|nr:ISKra4 family transposase [Herpetosiphonaceae bacterium]
MQFQIQVIVTQDDGTDLPPIEVVTLQRTALTPETVGLTLADGKLILSSIQATMTQAQVVVYTDAQQACSICHHARTRKGLHHLVYRTAFGTLSFPSPRFYSCPCTPQTSRSTSPLATLLGERTAPELSYLETKWASLVSYGVTVDLLAEVLPIHTHPATIQRQVHHVAERVEQAIAAAGPVSIEGCPAQWGRLPQPDEPLTVSIDGGYVHARTDTQRKAGCFEVIVAKSIPTDGPSRCMGFVHGYDQQPKRRLFELLTAQGLQMNQAITFLSDGGDTVRDLPLYLSPEANHLLDWFHVSMRLTVLVQGAKGLKREETRTSVLADLDRLKWFLWHGNLFRAFQVLEDLEAAVDEEQPTTEGKKITKWVHDFRRYIEINQPFIPNYGVRYHAGEPITSAPAESTVNQVVSKRMVKQQQMRWTMRGAHLLLQVRTQVLDDQWRRTFTQWYPGLQTAGGSVAAA